MSKRPVGMYFVIVWFVIFSFIHLQTVRRIVFQYNVKSGIRFIFAAALVLLIWEICMSECKCIKTKLRYHPG